MDRFKFAHIFPALFRLDTPEDLTFAGHAHEADGALPHGIGAEDGATQGAALIIGASACITKNSLHKQSCKGYNRIA